MTEKPDIYADRLSKMSPDEKAQIRAFLVSPLWLKFLRVVACKKPSSNVTNGGSGTRDEFSDARCNARLGEIRGWELYEFAIYLVLNEQEQKKTEVTESYPSAGRIDADWEQPPAKPSRKSK